MMANRIVNLFVEYRVARQLTTQTIAHLLKTSPLRIFIAANNDARLTVTHRVNRAVDRATVELAR